MLQREVKADNVPRVKGIILYYCEDILPTSSPLVTCILLYYSLLYDTILLYYNAAWVKGRFIVVPYYTVSKLLLEIASVCVFVYSRLIKCNYLPIYSNPLSNDAE